jgi:hypothetical protein
MLAPLFVDERRQPGFDQPPRVASAWPNASATAARCMASVTFARGNCDRSGS